MHEFWLGDRRVDLSEGTVSRFGHTETLLPKERDLLQALLQADGAVVAKAELLQRVWGYSERARSRTVDTTLRRLRVKIETHPERPVYLQTVRREGLQLLHVTADEPGPTKLMKHNAPAPVALVGRDGELAALLEEQRDIVLTGPAGIGKTALALSALHTWSRHGGSTVYVDASTLESELALGAALAEALELDIPPDQAFEAAGRVHRLLLVVDHIESLGPPALDALTSRTSGVRLVLCSRHIPNSCELKAHRLTPLSSSDSQALLRLAAGAEMLVEHDLRRLERAAGGVPMLLTLLGAFATGLGPEVDRWMLDLEGVPGNTLRTVLMREFERLRPDEQQTFITCSAFRAGFDAEAVAFVSGLRLPVVLRHLNTLHRKSLVLRDGTTLRLLPHLREFGRGHGSPDLHRVASWCASLQEETWGQSTIRARRHWSDIEHALRSPDPALAEGLAMTLFCCALRRDRCELAEDVLRGVLPVASGQFRDLLGVLLHHLRLRRGAKNEAPPRPELDDPVLQRFVHVMAATQAKGAEKLLDSDAAMLTTTPPNPSAIWLANTISLAAPYLPEPAAAKALRGALSEARKREWTDLARLASHALALDASYHRREAEALALLQSHASAPLERSYFELACWVHVHINCGHLEQALTATTPWRERARLRGNAEQVDEAAYNRLVIQFALRDDEKVREACADPPEQPGNLRDATLVLAGWSTGDRPSDSALGPLGPSIDAADEGTCPEPDPTWDTVLRLFSSTLFERWPESGGHRR